MAYPSIKVTFLGTGTSGGVPMVACQCEICLSHDNKDKRLRSSILVQSETTTIVVDTTPDFRQQMLRENVHHLDAVLLTHIHKDHIGGLDDTRAYQFFQQSPTKIYGNKYSLEGVKREIPYAFDGTNYPGLPVFDLNEIDLTPFVIGDIPIVPILVWHHLMPVYGYRFGDFTYITDANRIDEVEKEKIRDCNTLVLNALRKKKHISHFSLPEAIKLSQELTVNKTYLTHISHQMGRHADITSELPENIALAYDGLQLVF